MAEKYRSIRGTRDVLPEESLKWQYVERVAREVAESYGYGEIRIPTIEKTELFTRSVGETTDVVQKEMYSFEKGREDITLRPEGTAGTVRALLQNGMLNDAYPVKLHYTISCFRHENPQAGRYREFHQFGCECFGAEDSLQDAEMIAMLADLLHTLGVTGVELHLNSIGCKECKPAYNDKLIDYYNDHIDHICETCKERLERNPLRLLDCKVEGCQPIKEKAPKMIDHLCGDCEEHFDGLKESLNSMDIDFHIDPTLVRGLDYYSRTVFEFITTQIGAQGTICGGGRYDSLIETMGGPVTPALGFSIGLERLIMVMDACGAEFPDGVSCILYLGSMGKEEARTALSIACQLRREGFYVLCDTMGRSVRAQMKYADKKKVAYSCIIGSNELAEGKVSVKHMESGEVEMVDISGEAVAEFLWNKIEGDILASRDHIHELDELMDQLLTEED